MTINGDAIIQSAKNAENDDRPPIPPSKIVRAERDWYRAYADHERIDSERSHAAEQAAWETYAELCDEAQQCLQPGCRRTSIRTAYCSWHRAR